MIRNIDDKESEDGFKLTTTENSSRLDSIANFHIVTNNKAQFFNDTSSDEEQLQSSFNMPKDESNKIEDYKKTMITKERGISVTNMRSLSITRVSQQNKVVLIQKGYMSKRSPSIIHCWQRRFFILTNKRLQYYKSEQEFQNKKPPRGILNFQQVCIETEFKDIQLLIYLKIRGEQRIFQFKCANQTDYDTWKEKMTQVINESIGKIYKVDVNVYKPDLNPNEKFWRHLRITEKEFEEKADTGDLILCSNVKKDNQVRYEGAFLLFKMEDTLDMTQKGLFVLSPSQTTLDIIMGTWDQFKDFHMEHYTDICLRQLKTDRDENFLEASDDFMNELRNKPFFGDGKSDAKRSYSNIEVILKYLRRLNMIKQTTKDERKLPISSLGQANSFHLSLNNKDFLGEEQYLMLNKSSSILNTMNDQDQIQSMFDEIETKKKLNSVSEIEIENFKNLGQENQYQEIPDRQAGITKKDKEDFIQGVTNQ